MSGQSQPLSCSCGSFAEGMRTMNQSYLDMPDPNDFIRSTVLRGSGRQLLCSSQLRAQPPPYPIHDQDQGMSSEEVVHGSRSASLRQPTAEDFLPKRRSLPLRHSLLPQPAGGYHSHQNQPVIMPDSQPQNDSRQKQDAHTTNPKVANSEHMPKWRAKHSTNKSGRMSQRGAANKCSQSEPRPNSNASSTSSKTPSLRRHGRVQSIGSDTYQPALGGLHKISDLKRKDSKRDKVKRAMSKLNPLGRQRRS